MSYDGSTINAESVCGKRRRIDVYRPRSTCKAAQSNVHVSSAYACLNVVALFLTNITLLRLPPYAPELNPMENAWAYLHGNMLSMHVWDTYEEERRELLQRLEQPHGRRQTHRIHNDPHLGTGQDLRQLASGSPVLSRCALVCGACLCT